MIGLAVVASLVLAVQSGEGSGLDPLAILSGYGAIGVYSVLILVGVLVPGHIHKKVEERAARLEEENKKLYETIRTDILPVLHQSSTNATTVLKAAEALLSELERQRGASP